MKAKSSLPIVAALLIGAVQASAQSITFDFEDGTDQGFGTGFANDASAVIPIDFIGGSLRMRVVDTISFQEAGRESQNDAFLAAMNAAVLNPSGYLISYDWYVDTSAGNFGTFLQLGTYINSGAGGYAQDFPDSGKDVELDGTQLASGQVFSGTVTETLTTKYGTLDPSLFLGQTFMRFGLIINGSALGGGVHFDNISITPIPEPGSLALLGLAAPVLWMLRRRRSA